MYPCQSCCYSAWLKLSIKTRARICKHFKEPRNRLPAWRNRFLGSLTFTNTGSLRRIGLPYRPARLGINSWATYKVYNFGARICKRLWIPESDSEESTSPAYIACRAGTTNRVVVPGRESILGLLKRSTNTSSGAPLYQCSILVERGGPC
jgi:hypothetical protein